MRNHEYVFRGWAAAPVALLPGQELKVTELLTQYDQNKSRVQVDAELKQIMEQSPFLFPVDKIFHGTAHKRLGEAMGMQPFRLKLRPAMVLAKCADNSYFAIESKEIVSERLTNLLMKRYPRIVAHIICHSLGYATPSCAASILNDAAIRDENWCEWIYSCYKCDPLPAVRHAVQHSPARYQLGRHTHQGYMAEYSRAAELVRRAVETGRQPEFASWF